MKKFVGVVLGLMLLSACQTTSAVPQFGEKWTHAKNQFSDAWNHYLDNEVEGDVRAAFNGRVIGDRSAEAYRALFDSCATNQTPEMAAKVRQETERLAAEGKSWAINMYLAMYFGNKRTCVEITPENAYADVYAFRNMSDLARYQWGILTAYHFAPATSPSAYEIISNLADQGYAPAQWFAATMALQNGFTDDAVALFEKSAKGHYVASIRALHRMYSEGPLKGTNAKKAAYWAAEYDKVRHMFR